MRTSDSDMLTETLSHYPELVDKSFIAETWMTDTNNVALCEDANFGLFQYEYPGVYTGHYFFHVRGKEAKELAVKMLHEMFMRHGAMAIRGLTPIENRGAAWMSRQLGFVSDGVVTVDERPCYLFTLGLHAFYTKQHKMDFEIL